MFVTVNCPTCGIGRTETHCDGCGNLIPLEDLGTVAAVIQRGSDPARYLCTNCVNTPLTVANVGNPEPTPYGG